MRQESGKTRFLSVTSADLAAEVKTNMYEDMSEHGLPVEEVAKHQLFESRTVECCKNEHEIRSRRGSVGYTTAHAAKKQSTTQGMQ